MILKKLPGWVAAISFCLFCGWGIVYADDDPATDFIIQKPLPASWRISYEEVPYSATEKIGLLGAHYDMHLIEDVPEFYLGLGGYGSVSGEEGGFFTAGMTLGWRQKLFPKYALDIGAHFGGGGGSSQTFPGGGMIVRTHAALERELSPVHLRLGVAHTSFPNTTSTYDSDTHILLGIRMDTFDWRHLSKGSIASGTSLFKGKSNNYRVAPAFLYYKPDNRPITRTGAYTQPSTSSNKNIPLLGIQIDRFFTKNFYTMLEVYGAGGGGADGYATFFTGLGYSIPLGLGSKSLHWESKLLLGLGGDGRLDTGGGFIVQPMTGLRWDLSRQLAARAMLGRTIAPDGEFRATSYELGLVWQTEKPQATGNQTVAFPLNRYKTVNWATSLSQKTYRPSSASRRKDGSAYDRELHLIGLETSAPLNAWLEATGSTHWAYEGNIGSYAEGMLGLRLVPTFTRLQPLQLLAQYDVGVSGGGTVNVDGGVLHQARVGLRYSFSPKVSIDFSLGRIQSEKSSFKSDVLNLQLNWNHISAFRK